VAWQDQCWRRICFVLLFAGAYQEYGNKNNEWKNQAKPFGKGRNEIHGANLILI
jgi:hypothetical protein